MLDFLSCPDCGSAAIQIDKPISDNLPSPSADTCHCLECDHRWTLAIPTYPEAG